MNYELLRNYENCCYIIPLRQNIQN